MLEHPPGLTIHLLGGEVAVEDHSKQCCTCKELKPYSEFSRHASRPDGYQARCKLCYKVWYASNRERVREKVAAYRAENLDAVLAGKRRYRENNPEKVKAQSRAAYLARAEYYREQSRANYLKDRERYKQLNVVWAANNPDRARAIKSRYKHKRRALRDASACRVNGRDLKREFARQGARCVYCGATFPTFAAASWDHVVPVSRGGSFGVGNLVPCCQSCNSSKNNKTVMEWRMWKIRNGLL